VTTPVDFHGAYPLCQIVHRVKSSCSSE
jgi:hypothetical protein